MRWPKMEGKMRKIVAVVGASLALVVAGRSPSITVAVPTRRPDSVGVNPATNRIYVSNSDNDSISVIDGAQDKVIATIPVGDHPVGVGVNPATNRIYVAKYYGGWDSVAVIDGAQDKVITTIPMGDTSAEVAVNPITNRIYVSLGSSKFVAVIDGAQDKVIATIPVGGAPGGGVGVNPATNRIYVANYDSVLVIDGAQDKVIATIPVGGDGFPYGVGVNPTTNRIYVGHLFGRSVSVINGARDKVVATIPVGYDPAGVGVNPATNRIYVANRFSNSVSVIDGAQDKVIATVPVGDFALGVGVNPATNRIYVANRDSRNVSVLVGNDLLKNSSFDGHTSGGGLPDGWRGRNLGAGDGLDDDRTDVYDGKFSIRLVGEAGVTKELIQRIAAGGPAGTVLNLEAIGKADGMTPGEGEYRVKVQVVFADGTSTVVRLNLGRSDEGTFGWRRRARSFTVPQDYQRLVVSVSYENPTGTVWFDALHLWPSP